MRSMLLIRICALAALLFAGGLLRAQMPQFSSREEMKAWVKAHPAEFQRALDNAEKARLEELSKSGQTSASGKAVKPMTAAPEAVNAAPVKDEAYRANKEAYLKRMEDERIAKERAEKEAYYKAVAAEQAKAEAAEKAAKEQWLIEEAKVVLSREEYESVSPEKRAYIDSHPELYNITK